MRPILLIATLSLPMLGLAACGHAPPAPPQASGPTVNTIRGVDAGFAPLRPESGNIWADGLQEPRRAP